MQNLDGMAMTPYFKNILDGVVYEPYDSRNNTKISFDLLQQCSEENTHKERETRTHEERDSHRHIQSYQPQLQGLLQYYHQQQQQQQHYAQAYHHPPPQYAAYQEAAKDSSVYSGATCFHEPVQGAGVVEGETGRHASVSSEGNSRDLLVSPLDLCIPTPPPTTTAAFFSDVVRDTGRSLSLHHHEHYLHQQQYHHYERTHPHTHPPTHTHTQYTRLEEGRSASCVDLGGRQPKLAHRPRKLESPGRKVRGEEGGSSKLVWSAAVRGAFLESLEYIPKDDFSRIKLGAKMYGRNELISMYVDHKTHQRRKVKQVSSHLQVTKRRIVKKLQSPELYYLGADAETERQRDLRTLHLIDKGIEKSEANMTTFRAVFEPILAALEARPKVASESATSLASLAYSDSRGNTLVDDSF